MTKSLHYRSNKACRRVPVVVETLEKRVFLDATLPAVATPAAITYPHISAPTPVILTGTPPLTLTGTPGSISPSMMRQATGISGMYFQNPFTGGVVPADGTGQTIAIVVALGSLSINNDVQVFDQQWGLSNLDSEGNFFLTDDTYVTPDIAGIGSSGPTLAVRQSWADVASRDVEWAHAMAPGAHIVLIATPDSLLGYLAPADQDAMSTSLASYMGAEVGPVSVVINDWGIDVSGFPSGQSPSLYDSNFVNSTIPNGVTVFAASGDTSTLQYPSASQDVIGVGGTSNPGNSNSGSFKFTSINQWADSGGGLDTLYSPPYNAPLVSMDADPATGVWMYDSFTATPAPSGSQVPSGWKVVGGTGLATALMGGYWATVQQGVVLSTADSANPNGDPNATLNTTTSYNDLETAGEASPYYFNVAGSSNVFPPASDYPIYTPPAGGGTTATLNDAAIPNNGHSGFGNPIIRGSGAGILAGQPAQSAPYEIDGLTDLIVSDHAAQSISYLLTYTGNSTDNEPLELQHIGNPAVLYHFPAPSSHEVLDATTEQNEQNALDVYFPPPQPSMGQQPVYPVMSLEYLSIASAISNTAAGAEIGGQNGLNVDVDNVFNNTLDTSYNGAVTLTLTNPGLLTSATPSQMPVLSGVLSVNAVNGVANFNDVFIDQPGSGYVLNAAAMLGDGIGPTFTGLGGFAVLPAQSTPFNITALQIAAASIFSNQPISMTPQFQSMNESAALVNAEGKVLDWEDSSAI